MESYSINTRDYIGKMISFCRSQGVSINLQNPKTIQDKLAWLNIYDINPLKTKCADKIKIHDYCKEIIGEDICVPLLNTYKNASEINWNELPKSFVLKCNHGSGMNIIVTDKDKIDKKYIKAKLNSWLSVDFAFQNGFEAHYHDIEHKILVEKNICSKGKSVLDYKFWCFNGEPKLYTINGGNGHGDIMYYKIDGTQENLYGVADHNEYKKPEHLDYMIDVSRELSKDFQFVRVDMYEVDNTVYLGEMTFTPGAMTFKYTSREKDIEVGNLLKINKKRNKCLIYSVITGGYDNPIDDIERLEWCDYVMYSDVPLNLKNWENIVIDKKLIENYKQNKLCRYVKTHPNEFAAGYNVRVFIDANLKIDKNINEYIQSNVDNEITFKKHPTRNCIYKEISAVKSCGKETKDVCDKIRERYKNDGMPENLGLYETNIVISHSDNKEVDKLFDGWWSEIKEYSHRDQLSLTYVIWKQGIDGLISSANGNPSLSARAHKKLDKKYITEDKQKVEKIYKIKPNNTIVKKFTYPLA